MKSKSIKIQMMVSPYIKEKFDKAAEIRGENTSEFLRVAGEKLADETISKNV